MYFLAIPFALIANTLSNSEIFIYFNNPIVGNEQIFKGFCIIDIIGEKQQF